MTVLRPAKLLAKDATTSGVVDSKVKGAWRFLADRGGGLGNASRPPKRDFYASLKLLPGIV